jgi:hypothetical protein
MDQLTAHVPHPQKFADIAGTSTFGSGLSLLKLLQSLLERTQQVSKPEGGAYYIW